MNPRQMHYETLAGTIIKNLARRRMEGYYCATVEDAEKMAFSFLTPGCTVSFGGSMTLEDTGMLTALRHDPGITLLDRAEAKTPEETKKNLSRCSFFRFLFYEHQCDHQRRRTRQYRRHRQPCVSLNLRPRTRDRHGRHE